ncbi:MAG: hypothetical protein AAF573_03055 [Bacteroidota bacterium]
MIFSQKFIPYLLRSLRDKDYVLFEHFAIHKTSPEIPFNFLVRKKDHDAILDAVKAFSKVGFGAVKKQSGGASADVTLEDQSTVSLNFWYQPTMHNVHYFDPEAIFAKRQRSKSEFYMPNIEHLFEFAVLHHFMRDRGISPQYLTYFEDFHFFVKDGLLEFFNEKYMTAFPSLDDLTIFRESAKASIVDTLKQSPANQFFKKISLPWFGFRTEANP